MSKMDEEAYFEVLHRLEEKVSSPEDLSEFVAFLEEGYLAGAWEEQDASEYVGGIQGVLNGLEGLCMNYGYEYPEQPSWAWFARILRVAFGHS
ncbi:hypothetical protein [Magnetospira sp. QH-2]|uniref:DUF7660 family protein n=1 Tax=Magnetospira sp. (strain QH-2) TaxID=1288970 RepID=UPI0003E81487|nr:hypothetical protein [Magnetospira sp. QH-2]CCQ72492.1 protein of unknown function [Magnetospira sp. QH-2]